MTVGGSCRCGCGQQTPIAKKTRTALGHVKGEPTQYVAGHNRRITAPTPLGLAQCGRCDTQKPVEEFPQRSRGKLGVSSWCRACHQEYNAERYEPKPKVSWPLRFLRFIGGEDEHGCIWWRKTPDSRGYGAMTVDGRERRAHQLAYLLRHGELPPAGFHLHHVCENKLCVNPSHLAVLTEAEHHRLHGSGRSSS